MLDYKCWWRKKEHFPEFFVANHPVLTHENIWSIFYHIGCKTGSIFGFMTQSLSTAVIALKSYKRIKFKLMSPLFLFLLSEEIWDMQKSMIACHLKKDESTYRHLQSRPPWNSSDKESITTVHVCMTVFVRVLRVGSRQTPRSTEKWCWDRIFFSFLYLFSDWLPLSGWMKLGKRDGEEKAEYVFLTSLIHEVKVVRLCSRDHLQKAHP